jgi:hypothetical protein
VSWGVLSVAYCTLTLDDEGVLVADDALPEAEYALFEPDEIELGATEPGTIREAGFCTTAGAARARLDALGFTAREAHAAAEAARPTVARAYARGAAVRQASCALDAVELFEGARFLGESGYEGAWLELPALASDLALPGAAATLQALHLAALLAEHDDDATLTLSTADITLQRRPGARTYRRPHFAPLADLVRAMGTLRPGLRTCESGPGPNGIVSRLRARPRRTPASRDRMKAVESVLTTREAPATGPLADAELWNIELALCGGDSLRAVSLLDGVEQRRGRVPATAYLRAHAALRTGSEDPRGIAERASALSTSMSHFHELQLLSAQAWSAAGEPKRAIAFARDLVDNAAAPDSVRMLAQDVLAEATAAATRPTSERRVRTQVDTPARAPSLPPPSSSVGEPLAALGMPAGSLEAHAEGGAASAALPHTPLDARVYCTLLARELGRELHDLGVVARCDLDGLEAAQRHLREALPDAGTRALRPDETRHILRHGALLGELLARRLGAQWVDLEPPDPQRWAMLVPTWTTGSRAAPTRVWPFARVARFAVMGHKERDLVSYYLEVEARTRAG